MVEAEKMEILPLAGRQRQAVSANTHIEIWVAEDASFLSASLASYWMLWMSEVELTFINENLSIINSIWSSHLCCTGISSE